MAHIFTGDFEMPSAGLLGNAAELFWHSIKAIPGDDENLSTYQTEFKGFFISITVNKRTGGIQHISGSKSDGWKVDVQNINVRFHGNTAE